MKKKEKKLLKMMNEIERITISLKEIIAAMSPDERTKLAEKIKEKESFNASSKIVRQPHKKPQELPDEQSE